jgi:hypothetical protein
MKLMKVKKIIVLCPFCGHLYSWVVEKWSDEDNQCSLEICEFCQKVYYMGPVNRVGCLACDGNPCSGYEMSYMESGIVDVVADKKTIYVTKLKEEP